MAKTETAVSNLKINRGTLANIQANLSSIGENELIITTDKNVPTPAIADSGKVVKVNGSGEYELGNVIPTITIALSQVVSADPVEIQLTNDQYSVLTNNKIAIFDFTALGSVSRVFQYQGEESGYLYWYCMSVMGFANICDLQGTRIQIKETTKIAYIGQNYDWVEIGNINTMPSASGEYENMLVVGDNDDGLTFTNGLPYLTTAPSANNTEGNIKIVVLSSDPATKYSGYLYIITGSNS